MKRRAARVAAHGAEFSRRPRLTLAWHLDTAPPTVVWRGVPAGLAAAVARQPHSTKGSLRREIISAASPSRDGRALEISRSPHVYNAALRIAVGARVAELVDALDLESSGATRGSSSLPFRTILVSMAG